MSVSIRFSGAADGDDGPFQLASASGWQAFARWIEDMPYASLRRLIRDGVTKNTMMLAEALDDARREHPPEKDVMDTIEQLQEVLGVGDPDEVATVEM